MTVLLREAIGDRLRHARTTKHRTLRDISRAAKVSLGYLSEVERGQKEASSELLASICEALELPLGELLHHVAADVSALDKVDTAAIGESVEPVERGEPASAKAATGSDSGFEGGRMVSGGRMVTGVGGNDLADLRLSPTLRTTIHAPKSKAVLAA